MDEGEVPASLRDTPLPEHRARPGMELRTDCGRYPILDLTHDNCLVEVKGHATLRGYADIYDGDIQTSRCLILWSEPEGAYVRLSFKRNTLARSTPPADFAL